jgi:hypothetical protein
LRELPKALATTFILKKIKGTRVMTEPNGKNAKDVTMENPQTSS